MLDIHDRFDEIEEKLRSFEQKHNIKSTKFKQNFGELDAIGFKKALEILTERTVGFERWMKFHSSKLKKLEKECGIHNEAFSTLINHIQKECEIHFNFVEDNFYNLQSCVIFGLKDANKELEKLMNISLITRDNLDSVLDNENFQMVLNNNIFIKLGAKINSGFEKIRGFFRIFHNSEGLVLESSDGSEERSDNLEKIPRKISKGITKFEKNSDRFTEVLRDSVELVASKIIFEKAFNFFQSKILRIPRFCFVIVKRKLRNIFRN